MLDLIRCSNCEEDLPEDQFSEFQLGLADSICDICLDDMEEAEDEDENAEDEEGESEDDSF